MTFTIRSRLTIWFTLAFSAALLLVLGVLALKLKSRLDNEIRRTLRTEEQWITLRSSSEDEPCCWDGVTGGVIPCPRSIASAGLGSPLKPGVRIGA